MPPWHGLLTNISTNKESKIHNYLYLELGRNQDTFKTLLLGLGLIALNLNFYLKSVLKSQLRSESRNRSFLVASVVYPS